ncbi:hypothetical protein HanPI659440_Chr16g0642411 [Helianthus annuus]|nr:hypothetical protein HanPI659440_Chr16g0642411 [Helianthus annuus]
MSADRAVGEQEPDVLKIQLHQFLLPAVQADLTAFVSQPPPSGGSDASLEGTKKPSRIRITGKKIITAGPLLRLRRLAFLRPRRVLLLLPPLLAWSVHNTRLKGVG